MAAFPALVPSTRSYGFGLFPVTMQPTLGSGPVRFLHGTTRHGVQLQLGYEYISQAERDLLLDHYRGQDGGHRSFMLPNVIWAGHSAPDNIVPLGTAWIYVAEPDIEERSGLIYNAAVQLLQVI